MKIGMTLSAIKHIGPTIPGDLRAEPRISRSRLPGSNLLCIIVLIACIIILVVNELTRPNANLGLGISVGGDLVRGGAGKLDRIYKRRNQAIASNMRSRKKWEIEVFRRHTTAKSLERDIRVSRRLCLGVSA